MRTHLKRYSMFLLLSNLSSDWCVCSTGGAPTEAQPYKFLYVGRLSEEKNPGVFVRAMAKIKETLLTSSAYASRDIKDSIRGIVIGDGPLMGPMRTLVTSLGLGDLIEFTGHLPPKRVNEYMASGDVLVNPRGSGETFGYVHLEAVANGIPVVAFDRYLLVYDTSSCLYSNKYFNH